MNETIRTASISPPRQRMIGDMNVRRFSHQTQRNYRHDGGQRPRVMTLAIDEFIRRFLLHLLPCGFHRIRHYGLLAASARKLSLARARDLLTVAPPPADQKPQQQRDTCSPCPCCDGQMVVVEIFARWCQPRAPPRASCSAEKVSL